MVSFRPAKDKTHITQLLGRMVRTPLARRIPGNERLNAVDCLLPFFDEQSVTDVAKALMSGGDGGDDLPGRRVLINPAEMKPNPDIAEAVWEKLVALPSQTLPKRQARPVKRLTSLAHELAADGLLPEAGKLAHAEMHKVLQGTRARYKDEIAASRKAVMTVEGKSLKTDLKAGEMTFDDFLEVADYAVIEDAYRRAGRAVSPDLATTYSDYIAKLEGDPDDLEGALIEAHVTVAALGLVPQVKETLDAEAEKLATQWLTKYRVEIKSLSDERQDVYRQIREMSANPMDVDLARPSSWMQPTSIREANGTETPLPRFERHLLCGEDGLFPEDFNTWEGEVVKAELARAGAVGWYRNPSRASQDSLGVIYADGDEAKIVRPDFVFFGQLPDGSVVTDIVDPHGIQFGDAIPKLKGLARYAEACGGQYRRIEAVAKIGDKFRVLDLMEQSTRAAVAAATSIKALYESDAAADYLVYAIAQFNIDTLEIAQAVLEVAEEMRAPVILGVGQGADTGGRLEALAAMVRDRVGRSSLPVCLHLDHSHQIGQIVRAIRAGFTGVMIDVSAAPLAENIKATRQVLALCAEVDVGVEAELGRIAGVEDDLLVAKADAGKVSVETVRDFLAGVRPDALAVAVGTAHGIYDTEPEIRLRPSRGDPQPAASAARPARWLRPVRGDAAPRFLGGHRQV